MMSEFDRNKDPIKTMTVLQAIRWAIPAWEIDMGSDTIRKCFQKALVDEGTQEIRDKELLGEI